MTVISNKKTIISALVLGGLLFVFLNTASPFMHNHHADFDQHEDCLVHQMEAVFSIIVLAILLIFVAILDLNGNLTPNTPVPLRPQCHCCSIHNRAPPV